MSNKESFKVVCRLRPINQREKDLGGVICMSHTKESVKITVDEGVTEFTFDRVFAAESRQVEIFEYAAKPIIDGAMEGFNGTLFCYGQTSSGKTHTMEGKHDDLELRGIIPRMMEYIFEFIKDASNDLEFTVKCSFLEIYNEKIQDLLDPRKNNLMVKEEKSKGIWVEDATEIYVLSKEEMHDVFKIGSDNRKVAATGMNAKSSRSHSLFIVTIFQKNSMTDSTKTGKLYFVDLAGSEKMSKTGIEGGALLEEAKNINKSLLNLGMVINALTENRPHVPYRDSKLTRVLQESLGGNSQTTLIINCSMSANNDKESLSTLRFGQRAKAIKNKIVVNTERSAKELLLKLNEAEDKIKHLQMVIKSLQGENGVDIGSITNTSIGNNITQSLIQGNPNNTQQSTTTTDNTTNCEDCSNAMRKLLNQHIEMVTLQEELENARQDKEDLEQEIATRNNDMYELNERALMSELKAKLFIEEELKTFQELQFRLEHIFLLNQNKLLETNKIKNIIEKTRYEIIILMKSNKLKLEKHQIEGFTDEMSKLNGNLEGSLEILSRIEEYIINDNKNFNDLVDFISGKNMENDNLPEWGNTNNNYSSNFNNGNNSSSLPSNCVNLNINKNININIFDKKKKNNRSNRRRRRNSVSFGKSRSSFIGHNRTKSCVPSKTNRNSLNTMKRVKLIVEEDDKEKFITGNNNNNGGDIGNTGNILNSSSDSDVEDNSIDNNEETDNYIEVVDPNTNNNDKGEESPSEIYANTKDTPASPNISPKITQIIKKQRKTITDLAFQYKSINDTLSILNKENREKDLILNKNTETFIKTETKVKEYEEIIKELNEKLMKKEEEFDNYKMKTMMDFEYKEKKIVELINKVGDLEDENYKLVHFNKDKDKKKFHMMEKQVKEFTNEMQKLITENNKLKTNVDKKEEEMRNLYVKISDLENRLVQSVKHKMNDVSFAGNGAELQSGICTPITSYLNAKGFQCSTLSDILTAKLKNLNSISPKSGDDRRSSNNSVFNFNSSVSPNNKDGSGSNVGGNITNNNHPNNNEKNKSGKKVYHVNIHKNSNFNLKDIKININTNTNSPNYISGGNTNNNTGDASKNQNNHNTNNNTKLMRIIRGGGGKNSDFSNTQNFFFSKMLNPNTNYNPLLTLDKTKTEGKKKHLDQLRKEKYEMEQKYLDDELNNSKESEDVHNDSKKSITTPQKEKGGFFNFITKIIK